MFRYVIHLCAFVIFSQNVNADELDGIWEFYGTATNEKIELLDLEKTPRQQWVFRGSKLTILRQEKNVIPRNGSIIDIKFDTTKTPNRLSLMDDFNEDIEVYCIYKRTGGKLMIKMLVPLGLLNNDGVTKTDIDEFLKQPFPSDFRPPRPNGYESIVLLQKTENKLPDPNDKKPQKK